MKAYIITEQQMRQLKESLELSAMRRNNVGRHDEESAVVQDVWRSFNFVVCRWISEMGGDT